MKRILDNIKYVKINDIFSPFIFIIVLIPSMIFKSINKIKGRKLYLVCENGKTARDNGYHFYKYIRENHKGDYCFYVIDKKCNDYNKVKEFNNIIQFKSLKHWIYYLAADYNISNHKNGNPNQIFFYVLHVVLNLFNNRVFLQHGITKDDAKWLYYKNTKFRYFICGAREEYEFIKEKFGYPEGYVVYTGFPRFDNLYNNKVNEKQVLIMPTWRSYLGRETNSFGEKIDFKSTTYYKYWNSLLNDKEFKDYIESNNIKVLFYPHIDMQKYLNEFTINSKNIKIVDSSTDIQKTLKESKVLITDYSSVYMDFAYMNKLTIYYHFDYEEYREKQYQDGYFDYNKNGFGPVCKSNMEILNNLKKVYDNKINDKYYKNINKFFDLKDQNNSKRIYELLGGDKNE